MLEAIWFILPAYIANASAVVLGGGKPIDGGKTWRGKPIFGEGKTWRGFFGGVVVGMISGIIMNLISNSFGEGLPSLLIIFSLSIGALLGDLIKSFFKRRIGKKRGEKWIFIDQIDFLLGAFLFCYVMSCFLYNVHAINYNWFTENFPPSNILFLIIITPLFHLATNIIAYLLKLKEVPW